MNHYSRQVSKKTQILHDGQIEASPILSLFFGIPGTSLGLFTNFWQIYTTEIGFMEMIADRTGLFGFLNMLPAMTKTGSTSTNTATITCWILAIAVQFGVIFLSLRIEKEFKRQLAAAEGNKAQKVGIAAKGTMIVISHNRDFFTYYGGVCFALDGLGDYAYVTTLTGNVIFLMCYGIIIMMTSTAILAVAAEWLWIGILAIINAVAQANAQARAMPKP